MGVPYEAAGFCSMAFSKGQMLIHARLKKTRSYGLEDATLITFFAARYHACIRDVRNLE
jgi:hypothetical protein